MVDLRRLRFFGVKIDSVFGQSVWFEWKRKCRQSFELIVEKEEEHSSDFRLDAKKATDLGLLQFDEVIALGGKQYRSVVDLGTE